MAARRPPVSARIVGPRSSRSAKAAKVGPSGLAANQGIPRKQRPDSGQTRPPFGGPLYGDVDSIPQDPAPACEGRGLFLTAPRPDARIPFVPEPCGSGG